MPQLRRMSGVTALAVGPDYLVQRQNWTACAQHALPSCLIPRFDGAIHSLDWKEALWDKFVMAAPRPRTPSTQLMSAAGRQGSVAASTVIAVRGTSDAEKLKRACNDLERAARAGLGTGVDVSDFDDPHAALLAINAHMKQVDTELTLQRKRPPALMVSCSARHPRVGEFFRAKQQADLRNWVANISVAMPDDADCWHRYGREIARCAWLNGEPGLLFIDAAERDNATPDLPLKSTAPCAEVFLAEDEQCVFWTVNIAAHVEDGRVNWSTLGQSIELSVFGADAAVDLISEAANPIVAAKRRIGVGLCGYHSALMLLDIPYSHSSALAWQISEHHLYHAHKASAELARDLGSFPLIDQSRWRSRAWRERKFPFLGKFIGEKAWHDLQAMIDCDGVRNSAITAFPPTGVSSDLVAASKSFEPYFQLTGHAGIASKRAATIHPAVYSAMVANDVREEDVWGQSATARLTDQPHFSGPV